MNISLKTIIDLLEQELNEAKDANRVPFSDQGTINIDYAIALKAKLRRIARKEEMRSFDYRLSDETNSDE